MAQTNQAGSPILGSPTGEMFTPGAAPDSQEYSDSFRPNVQQVWEEQVDINSINSIVGIPGRDGMEGGGIRALTEWQARDKGKQYTGKELNEMFSELPAENKFSDAEKLNLYQATLRVENLKRIQEKKNWMAMGAPLDTWDNLTAGAMQGLDPVNLGAGMLFGGGSIAMKVMGNIAGNLLVDVPTTMLLRRENQKVNYMETAIGSVGGGIVGTAVGEALGLAAKGLVYGSAKVLNRVKGAVDTMPVETKAAAFGVARAQIDTNSKVNVEKVITPHMDRLGGKVEVDFPPTAPPIPGMADTVAYSVTHPDSGAPMHMGDNYGPGKYITTDKAKANSLGANAEGATVGKITSHGIGPDAKWLDIDAPASDPKIGSIITSLIEKMGVTKEDIGFDDTMTIRDLMEGIEGVTDDVHAIAKENKFSGLEWADGSEGHKTKLVFDEALDQVEDVADVAPSKEMSPKMDRKALVEVIDDAEKKENNIFYDEEAVKKIEEHASKSLEDPIEEDRLIAAMEEREKQLLADPASDPDLVEQLTLAKKEFADAEKDSKAFQDLANCIIGKKT